MMLVSLGNYKFYSMLDQMQLQSMFSPFPTHEDELSQRTVLSKLNGKSIVLISIGAFNPPHYFHLRMFERAREYIQKTLGHTVLEGVFSPISNTFGQSNLVANEKRVKMLEISTQNTDWIRISDWQSRQKNPQNYINVLGHLQEEYKCRFGSNQVQLMLVCGSDLLDSFVSLNYQRDPQLILLNEELEDIVANHGLIVLSRPNTSPYKTIYSSDILRKYEKNVYVINDETSLSSLSSTRLRMAIRRGESIRFCLNDQVIEYIERNGLYRSTPKRPAETRKESAESVSLDELLELSTKWADYFNNQLNTQFMVDSTQSLPNSARIDHSEMNLSSPAVFNRSPPQSPRPISKAVHFNLKNSRGSTISEPCLPRRGIRLRFRQYNLSSTTETTI